MRPEEALVRGVGVVGCVGVLVVVAVAGDPHNGVALERVHAAIGGEVLDPLRRLEGLVCKLAVIAEGDANATGGNIGEEEGSKGGPGEEERRGKSTDMEAAEDAYVGKVSGGPGAIAPWAHGGGKDIAIEHTVHRLLALPLPAT